MAMRWMRIMSVAFVLFMLGTGQAFAEQEITNSGENLRTGWYPESSTITPQLVSGGTFGQLWSTPVEGQVYAQPLLDDGTLFVATEKNKVYGLNPKTGALNWSEPLSLGKPWNPEEIKCGDLTPSIGVTATPVIDAETGIAYLTYKTYVGETTKARWYMDAVSVATGKQQPGFPVELSGTAQNEEGQTFEPERELQRPGLLLLEGAVYAAFGSDCDDDPYQGWVFGVSTSGAVKARWTSETAYNGSGIWQSGAGIMSDGPGTMLISTGNGGVPEPPTPGSSPPGSLGESIVRLRVQPNGSLKATDFFAPFNAGELSSWDADFASGGVTGLPDEYFGTPSIPSLAVAVGKDGYVYLLNRENLGGIGEGPGGSDDVVQRIGPYGGVWSRPGVWPGEGGWVYIPTASNGTSASGSSGNLQVYQYGVSGTGSPTLSLQGTSKEAFGFSSSAPVITSEGTTPGTALVWLIWAPNGTGVGAQLRAYNPVPEHGEPILRWSAPIGTSAKFATPDVGAGRLYVGTRDGHVLAFGSPVTPILSGPATEFPTTTVGKSSLRTATLTATEPLIVSSLTSSSSQFTVGTPSIPLPATLTTGQTIEVPITFTPTTSGPLGATLTATTSTGKTASFSLSGEGLAAAAQIEASPLVVTFDPTSVGESVSAGATFRNVGGAPLTIESVNPPSAPFEATGLPTVDSTIEPGHSITVTVNFNPTEVGDFNGEISLGTSAGEGTVALSGSAGLPGDLQVSSETNDYEQVRLGEEITKTFTITNIGGTTVKVNKSKPPSGGEFNATTMLPEGTTIAPGETLTEKVVFAPTALGAAEGVWLINGTGTSGLLEVHFTGVGVSAPAVETGAASSLTQTSATLNATVNPGGETVSACRFEYGTTLSYGSSVPCATLPGSGDAAVPVSAAIGSLAPGTAYHFRVVATNPLGTTDGAAASLTTKPAAPTVETDAASLVAQTSATLDATVNPNGANVSNCHFEYGTTTSYGTSVACASAPGSGTTPVGVSAPIAGLVADTTYDFRIVATNAVGTSYGTAGSLTTKAAAPTVETGAASSVAQTSAILNASVNPNNETVSDCHFEYGKTISYGTSVPCTTLPGGGSSPVGVSAAIEGLAPGTEYHYRIVATNPTGTSYGAAASLTTKPAAPTVETAAASLVAQASATLNATVNPNGANVSSCHFEYGTTTSYGTSVACASAPGSGTAPVGVSAPIAGLDANTTYYFRIVATNSVGTNDGTAGSLTTKAAAPTVETGTASSLAQTSATLNASVNPNNETVSDCHFEYGKTISYGTSVPCTTLPGGGSSAVAVSAPIEGLAPGTEYHYRIVATNPTGTSYGNAGSLTTKPAQPAVETDAASLVAHTSATLNATVNPNGAAISNCHFEYGTSTSYGTSVACVSAPGSGTAPVGVSAPITGLDNNTTYYFQIVATNSVGTSDGSPTSFTTKAAPPTVETAAASAVASTSATLNASVNPNSETVSDCHFEYGATSSYGSSVPCKTLPGNGASLVAVSAPIEGLVPGTEYHYRIVATNPTGTSHGTDGSLTAKPAAPAAETGAATSVAQTSAALNATVNPNGDSVSDCHFEYGTTGAYGASAPCATPPGSGSGAVAVSAPIEGLSPGTTYDYRIVASNSLGTAYGFAATLTTLAATSTGPLTGVLPDIETMIAPALPIAVLGSTTLNASANGTITVRVGCPQDVANCAGTLTLRTLTAVTATHSQPAKAILTLASGSFVVAGGHATTVKLHLSSRARTLLKRQHRLRASATLAVHDTAGTKDTTHAVVTIRLATPKRRG
jgi:phosphodiesterase/alkaline phosphatase D-like protein